MHIYIFLNGHIYLPHRKVSTSQGNFETASNVYTSIWCYFYFTLYNVRTGRCINLHFSYSFYEFCSDVVNSLSHPIPINSKHLQCPLLLKAQLTHLHISPRTVRKQIDKSTIKLKTPSNAMMKNLIIIKLYLKSNFVSLKKY